MLSQALPVALLSAAVFGGLSLMSDRPRGASIAQAVLVVGAVLVFVAIAVPGGIAGLPPERIAGFGVGLMSAAVAGMLYHLYLGRFDQVWTARGVFLLVYLVVSALFGLIFLSLI
jgi:MFS superfamily sulfate permease-like transporter